MTAVKVTAHEAAVTFLSQFIQFKSAFVAADRFCRVTAVLQGIGGCHNAA